MLISRLILASIMCSFFVEQREARRIQHRLHDNRNAEEEFIHMIAFSGGRRLRRDSDSDSDSGVEKMTVSEPSPSQKKVELEALQTIRQLEQLEDAMDAVEKGDMELQGGHANTDTEIGKLTDILKQYSDKNQGDKLETKKHKIRRIITEIHEPAEPDEDDKNSGLKVALSVRKRGTRESSKGRGESEPPLDRRSARRKRKGVKIVQEDDDDDDDDDEDEEEEMEIVEYTDSARPRKKKKSKVFLPMPKRRKRPRKKHHRQQTLQLPPDVLEAMHEVKKAKEKPRPTIQIIEVERKEDIKESTPPPGGPLGPGGMPMGGPPGFGGPPGMGRPPMMMG
ncbi:ABC transporter F family member 4-like [Littorina saxatilis]|uniref:Uncharacterized protein n=1 Tax=Littorina saxatilis TaxID=31220 RepID=A0AAN9FY67_9CAEN